MTSSDTYVLTDNGYIQIKELVDKNFNVWNGKQFVQTKLIPCSGIDSLIRITLSNGLYVDCEAESKWVVLNKNKDKEIVGANELKKGDVLYEYNIPLQNYKDPTYIKDPYELGCRVFDDDDDYDDSDDDIFIPLNYSKDIKLKWMEGLCDTHGYLNDDKIKLYTDEEDAMKIQLMLSTLRIDTTYKSHPYDGGYIYILINDQLRTSGFNPKKIKLGKKDAIKNEEKIMSIMPTIMALADKAIPQKYTFSKFKKNTIVLNGILIGL